MVYATRRQFIRTTGAALGLTLFPSSVYAQDKGLAQRVARYVAETRNGIGITHKEEPYYDGLEPLRRIDPNIGGQDTSKIMHYVALDTSDFSARIEAEIFLKDNKPNYGDSRNMLDIQSFRMKSEPNSSVSFSDDGIDGVVDSGVVSTNAFIIANIRSSPEIVQERYIDILRRLNQFYQILVRK